LILGLQYDKPSPDLWNPKSIWSSDKDGVHFWLEVGDHRASIFNKYMTNLHTAAEIENGRPIILTMLPSGSVPFWPLGSLLGPFSG
jgi:hypothetical protein